MLSSASSDGALSIESRQGSEVLPSSAEAQPASDAPAASSQPGDSMLLDPDKTSETAEELTERSGDTEMDLVGEPVFTPAKARPDVDAASLIEVQRLSPDAHLTFLPLWTLGSTPEPSILSLGKCSRS